MTTTPPTSWPWNWGARWWVSRFSRRARPRQARRPRAVATLPGAWPTTPHQSLRAPERAYADVLTAAWALDRATTSANPSASAPLRVKLSQHGVGLSAGVTRARFGVDAGGYPYVHAGRHGLYSRKRWPIPSSPPRDPLALPRRGAVLRHTPAPGGGGG